MKDNIFKRFHIGRCLIIAILFLGVAFSEYCFYQVFFSHDVACPGTVLAKNETMTSGKFPKQKYIISFKYDEPKLGTKDITVSFSTWNNLNKGDRASFYKNSFELNHFDDRTIYHICGCLGFILNIGLGFILLYLLFAGAYYIWENF